MTIKTIDQLEADFASGVFREHTAEKIRDLIDSLTGVGGVMSGSNNILDIEDTYKPFDGFDTSIDTKGVTDNVPVAEYTFQAGADGIYALDVSLGIETGPTGGTIDISLFKNGTQLIFNRTRAFATNDQGSMDIAGGFRFAATDTIQLGMKASGTPPPGQLPTLVDGTFRIIRIGK